MSQPPNPNNPHSRGAEHSQALDQYNRLSASGHFEFAMTSGPGYQNGYAPKPAPAPPSARPGDPQLQRWLHSTVGLPIHRQTLASFPQGGPVRAPVLHQPNVATPYDNMGAAPNGLMPPPPPPRQTYNPPRPHTPHQPPAVISPYATHSQRPQTQVQAPQFAHSRALTASRFVPNPQHASAAPPPPQMPYQGQSGHMPQLGGHGGTVPRMPWQQNGHNAPYLQVAQPQLPAMMPGSITLEGLSARMKGLLEPYLPGWTSHDVQLLCVRLTNEVVHMGKREELGPDGLQSYKDIFMTFGYENKGTAVYMALAVTSEMEVKVLLRGPMRAFKGGNVFNDVYTVHELKQGFFNAAVLKANAIKETFKPNEQRRR